MIPIAVLIATLGVVAGCDDADETDDRPFDAKDPNFVVIQLDDASAAVMSKRAMPRTYRLLRSERGTVLSNYIFPTPICCPSRASLLTGQTAQHHGVLSNKPGYEELLEPDNTLATWLERDGYETIHLGKFLNGSAGRAKSVRPDGWTDWQAALEPQGYENYTIQSEGPKGPKEDFGTAPEDYFTTQINSEAVAKIERYAAADRPFYLEVDHLAPHVDLKSSDETEGPCGPDQAIPARRDWDKLGKLPVRVPLGARERDLSDKPPFIRRELEPLTKARLDRVRSSLQCAAAAMLEVDRGVEAIFTALDDAGARDDTVVMVINDNGFFYGEHGIDAGKDLPYEASLASPAFVWAPRAVVGARPPSKVDALTANIDLAPTMLELAEAESCAGGGECRTEDGRSLVSLLRGDGRRFRDRALLIEVPEQGKKAARPGRACWWEGVRTADEVYVRYPMLPVNSKTRPDITRRAKREGRKPLYPCMPSKADEYYDLDRDPLQLSNQPQSARAERLRRLLRELRGCEPMACD